MPRTDAGSRIGCGRPFRITTSFTPLYVELAVDQPLRRSSSNAQATICRINAKVAAPPSARLIPVKAARAPQHNTVVHRDRPCSAGIAISGVDVLKLLRRSVVVLRPEVEKDRLAWTERAIFRRFVRSRVVHAHDCRRRCTSMGRTRRTCRRAAARSPIFRRHSGQWCCNRNTDTLPGASARVQSARVASTCKCCSRRREAFSAAAFRCPGRWPGLDIFAATIASNRVRLGSTP